MQQIYTIESMIQERYRLIPKLLDADTTIFDHNTTKDHTPSDDPMEHTRLYRVDSFEGTTYELFCIYCRRTLVTFTV
ncbi:MAG: hypothetical protein ACXAE3_16870 [Candidatus Kariarchaeaceae archaeon]|jgi:hypothetical protein